MNKIVYLFSLFIVCIAALLLIGSTYQYLSTKHDNLLYPPLGRLAKVNGGTIHYLCRGKTGPTVILDAWLGADHQWWYLVQEEVAKFAQVLSFDRPGYGWSDSGINTRTSKHIVSELHDLLQATELNPPYILIGHSFGGANMRLYANTYPEEVAGLILVDPCHEDQNFEKDVSSKGFLERCKGYLFDGTFSHYVGISRWFMPESLKPFFSSLMSQEQRDSIIAKASSVKSLSARDNEMIHLKKSLSQLKRSKNSLEDKPVIVISAEETNNDPQWQQYQKQLVSLSKKGKQIIAKSSSHMVNVDKPEVIIEAAKEIIDMCN